MSDAFCPLPWIFQAIRNNGDLRVCCQANQGYDRGLLRKIDKTIYNAKIDDLEEARNASLMKEIRLDMLAGRWNPACSRCEKEERAGIKSRKRNENELWKNEFDSTLAKDVTHPDGSIDTKKIPLRYYDVRLGNLCNLKCRSCGPTDSSSWYEDYVNVWNYNKYNESFGDVTIKQTSSGKFKPTKDHYGWYKNDIFWKGLERNIHNIKHFQCVGGEPLLIRRQWDFLWKCIKNNVASNMIIEYNSNITKIPKEAWEVWKFFKEVRIGASVDGFGQYNDYIRSGSKWDQVEKNLDLFETQKKNFNVWITITVMAYNIFYFGDILKFFLKKNYLHVNSSPKNLILTPHPLHGPPFLNIKVFPNEVKNAIAYKLRSQLEELKDLASQFRPKHEVEQYHKVINKLIEHYLTFMYQEDLSSNFRKFWEYTKKLDNLRNESFENVFPEFYNVIRPHVKSM